MSERWGVYPGTFDPPTHGHADIIQRAAGIVDRLVVAVAANVGKGPLFSLAERCEMAQEEVDALQLTDRVKIIEFDELLVQFAHRHGASVIVRGLRAVSDFEFEFQMAAINARLAPSIETVFLMASERHQFLSSRFIKEVGLLGGDIDKFTSPRVAERLRQRSSR